MAQTALHSPVTRESKYGRNVAQYLVDLHDARAVFDFCGGMMFQLVLSEKLRAHLAAVAKAGADDPRQPVVYGATTARMSQVPGYEKSALADNAQLFHGREVRKVPNAAGGMQFALQLAFAGDDAAGGGADAEGWTAQERGDYSGWGHDSSRLWRNGEQLESEGVRGYRNKFGPQAYGLHHRFYWHLDRGNQLWLSAEDGCEGRLFGADAGAGR